MNSDNNTYNIHEGCFFYSLSREICYEGDVAELSFLEANVLEVLCKNVNKVVTKKEIFDYSWSGRVVSDNALAKTISSIRNKLKEIGVEKDVLITIPRVGYKLEYDIHEEFPSVARGRVKIFNLFFVSFLSILVVLSIYNFFYRIDTDFSRGYISPGYIKESISINNKAYTVVHQESVILPMAVKELFSAIPSCGLFFYDEENNTINISFSIGKEPLSFVFFKENFENASKVIIDKINEDRTVCGK